MKPCKSHGSMEHNQLHVNASGVRATSELLRSMSQANTRLLHGSKQDTHDGTLATTHLQYSRHGLSNPPCHHDVIACTLATLECNMVLNSNSEIQSCLTRHETCGAITLPLHAHNTANAPMIRYTMKQLHPRLTFRLRCGSNIHPVLHTFGGKVCLQLSGDIFRRCQHGHFGLIIRRASQERSKSVG